MKCIDVENFLDDFANNELDFAARQKIERHLQECPFCQNAAEELRETNFALKNLAAIAPSKQFDARMMQAFRVYQQKQIKPSFWTTFFASFSISKPAFACALLAFAIVSILAFQIGRLTAPESEIAKTQEISQIKSSENDPPVQIVEKRIEIPVTKIVEVPVYKEKIVNRIVYKNREVFTPTKLSNEEKLRETNFDSQNTAITYIQNSNEILTPINLKNFQPVSEIKIEIIKRGKDNEK